MKKKECIHKTSIGGQAVLEGVMMRGVDKACVAVRTSEGDIRVEPLKAGSASNRPRILKLPIVRGVVSFVDSLVLGVRSINQSAMMFGLEEEEPSRFEKWLSSKTGKSAADIAIALGLVLGVALAVGLFVIAPPALVKLVFGGDTSNIARPLLTLFEGGVRLIIFLIYLIAVSFTKDIRRVFQYHGAEHKSIFCYEHGEELTVENARKYTRLHPRCGTSFLLIVMLVSILVFSLVTWDSFFVRILLKLLLMPLVAGISYEIIRYAGRHDNILSRVLSAPGLALQNITTREPDDSQIEVAIAALKAVLTGNPEDDKW